jgi:uncharacterized protein (TIGR02678 family)
MSVIERPKPAEDVYAAAERRTAARALLNHPLLSADGPQAEEFRLVRRHRAELARMFADGLGYRLVVDPQVARLYKPGLGRDPSRPLEKNSGASFTPRAYALFCLSIAALTKAKQQLLVDELVAAIRSAVAEAGLDVDLDQVGDRRALYAAFTALVKFGVLRERDGNLERWVNDGRSPTLLDVGRDRLAMLVSAPLASATSPDELLETAALPSAAGGARVAVRRRLAESAVLSTADLSEEYAEWWRRNRNREREWFSDRLGLELELRAEGAIAVDPDDELTDIVFPGGGSGKHFALLLAGALVERVRGRARDAADRTWADVSAAEVDAAAAEVYDAWSPGLNKEHKENPAAAKAEALALLASFGLIEPAGDAADGALRLHAAAARYAPQPLLEASIGRPAASGEASLFAEEDAP